MNITNDMTPEDLERKVAAIKLRQREFDVLWRAVVKRTPLQKGRERMAAQQACWELYYLLKPIAP